MDIECSVEGCSRPVQARGWCKGHWQRWRDNGAVGGADFRAVSSNEGKTCAVDVCDRPAKTRGWCKPHYERWRTTGDVGSSEIHDGKRKTCKVEGCDRPAAAQRLCQTHYQRFRTTGDPGGAEMVPWSRQTGLCSVEACDRPARTRSWCQAHYNRVVTTGDPGTTPIKPKIRVQCSIDGCDRDVASYGLCSMHRRRMKKTGSTGTPQRGRTQSAVCVVDGCDKRTKALSLCGTHYQRQFKTGTTDPNPDRVSRGGPDTACAHPGCPRTIGRDGAKGFCHTHHERLQSRIRKFGTADIGDPYRVDRPTYVYLMRSRAKGGTWKIGHSVHVPTRKNSLRQGYIVVVSWLLPTKDLACYIESVIKLEWRAAGLPPALAKGAEGYTETVLMKHVSQESVVSRVEELRADLVEDAS